MEGREKRIYEFYYLTTTDGASLVSVRHPQQNRRRPMLTSSLFRMFIISFRRYLFLTHSLRGSLKFILNIDFLRIMQDDEVVVWKGKERKRRTIIHILCFFSGEVSEYKEKNVEKRKERERNVVNGNL